MSSRMLVVTADAFRVPTGAQANRERKLFRDLAQGTQTLFEADALWCREWLLELIARAASAGTDVMFLGEAPGDFESTDFLSSFGVSVKACFRFVSVPIELAEPNRSKAPGGRLRERVDVFNTLRGDEVYTAPLMTVVIDRQFDSNSYRQYFRRHEKISGGVLTLIQPSQWGGLALADYANACSSLRIAQPAPQPVESPTDESAKYDSDPGEIF